MSSLESLKEVLLATAEFEPPMDEEDTSKIVRELIKYVQDNETEGYELLTNSKSLFAITVAIDTITDSMFKAVEESSELAKKLIKENKKSDKESEELMKAAKSFASIKLISKLAVLLDAYKKGKFQIK